MVFSSTNSLLAISLDASPFNISRKTFNSALDKLDNKFVSIGTFMIKKIKVNCPYVTGFEIVVVESIEGNTARLNTGYRIFSSSMDDLFPLNIRNLKILAFVEPRVKKYSKVISQPLHDYLVNISNDLYKGRDQIRFVQFFQKLKVADEYVDATRKLHAGIKERRSTGC